MSEPDILKMCYRGKFLNFLFYFCAVYAANHSVKIDKVGVLVFLHRYNQDEGGNNNQGYHNLFSCVLLHFP